METVITDYKEVFQLAESKGYKLLKKLRYYSDTNILVELTLIQKWLREKKNILVWVVPEFYDKFYYRINGRTVPMGREETYEQALLQGISAALQLI